MDRIGLDVLDAVSRLLVEHGGRFVICSASETIGDFVPRARVPAITIVPIPVTSRPSRRRGRHA